MFHCFLLFASAAQRNRCGTAVTNLSCTVASHFDPYPLSMSSKGEYRVGVAGATGAVGSTILKVLAERRFPASGSWFRSPPRGPPAAR